MRRVTDDRFDGRESAEEILSKSPHPGMIQEIGSTILFTGVGVYLVHHYSGFALIGAGFLVVIVSLYALAAGEGGFITDALNLGAGVVHVGRRYVPIPVGPILVVAYALLWHLALAPSADERDHTSGGRYYELKTPIRSGEELSPEVVEDLRRSLPR